MTEEFGVDANRTTTFMGHEPGHVLQEKGVLSNIYNELADQFESLPLRHCGPFWSRSSPGLVSNLWIAVSMPSASVQFCAIPHDVRVR